MSVIRFRSTNGNRVLFSIMINNPKDTAATANRPTNSKPFPSLCSRYEMPTRNVTTVTASKSAPFKSIDTADRFSELVSISTGVLT